jgi:1-deoxy-D-xylulose-5-phosphate synthase
MNDAITAGMPTGTGMSRFQAEFPDRFVDVGIAEQHSMALATGLAMGGMRPVVALYSTFLQRAFDQIVHDVALQHVPVIFAIDRAGIVGADGPTHHGVLDLSYMRCVPGMIVSAPRDGNELRDLLWTALTQNDAPFSIRYPRDTVPGGFDPRQPPRVLPIGSWEILDEGSDVMLLAVGAMVESAREACRQLSSSGVSTGVVNCRFVKPLDRGTLRRVRSTARLLVTIEENNLPGGFGEGVLDALSEDGLSGDGVLRLGLADGFVTHGSRAELIAEVGLDAAGILRRVRACLAS